MSEGKRTKLIVDEKFKSTEDNRKQSFNECLIKVLKKSRLTKSA